MQKIISYISVVLLVGLLGVGAAHAETTAATSAPASTKATATKVGDTTTTSETVNPENTSSTTAAAKAAIKPSTEAKATIAPTSADVDTAKKKADDALVAYRAAKSTDKLTNLKAYGDHAIDQRVAELQKFEASGLKGLSDAQIAAMKVKIDKNITDLQALKVKIDATTTVDAAKTLVQSIYTEFRIYALFMPDMNLTVAAEQMSTAVTKLTAMTARMQKAIDAATIAGTDTTTLTAALKDYTAQLADATTNIAAAKTEVAKIDVTQFDASKTARTTARADLTKARANLVAARGDMKTFSDTLGAKTTTKATTPATATDGTTKSVTPTTSTGATTSGGTSVTR